MLNLTTKTGNKRPWKTTSNLRVISQNIKTPLNIIFDLVSLFLGYGPL